VTIKEGKMINILIEL